MKVNAVTFPSADGTTQLQGLWHPPTQRATNGALIVLHGSSYAKEADLNRWICEGAAQIGLTALRFDFRYVQAKQSPSQDLSSELDDLMGAFNFLDSFGKEIKPKRLYLVGKSLGAIVAMKATAGGPLAEKANGVAALGLPLHTPDKQTWFDYSALAKLVCPALFVIGDRDDLGDPIELQPLYQSLNVPKELVVIPGVGHSYEPIVLPSEPTLDQVSFEAQTHQNQQKVAEIVIKWLGEQDKIREDLRK